MIKSNGGLVLVTAMLLAGGSACSKQSDTGRPYSVDMVRRVFQQETGEELVIKSSGHGVPVLGDVTELGVGPKLRAKYGDFAIVVFRRLGKHKRALLDAGEAPGQNGINWQYHPGENDGDVPIWSAGKYYGNVVLTWYHKTRETNGQWDRLDRALRLLDNSKL